MTVTTSAINGSSEVLALVPHHACEEWLGECLDSLVCQTRQLNGIVVLNDAESPPPVEIVARFPTVTLLAARSRRNVGPYRLVQQAIDRFHYDAYMFQDADDWSGEDRLERLLAAGEETGAELIGCQEVRLLCEEGEAVPFRYPADVNAALRESPTAFPLLHPTSVVADALVQRLGGFATGLRFAGDAEFLRRAHYVALVRNVPEFAYFRRIRTNSLTTAATTGMHSPARQALMKQLHERARQNASRHQTGRTPNLRPYRRARPLGLEHVRGPRLRERTPSESEHGGQR